MKIYEFYCHVGLELEESHFKAIVGVYGEHSKEQVVQRLTLESLYPKALEMVEGWVGMHGFDVELDENGDDLDTSSIEYVDAVQNLIEENIFYTVAPWDSEYTDECTYSTGLAVENYILNF